VDFSLFSVFPAFFDCGFFDRVAKAGAVFGRRRFSKQSSFSDDSPCPHL